MSAFDPRPYLKDIARKHGARDLSREQARELFAAILAGEVNEVALGAILLALRVKGESAAELAGMMEALEPHVEPIRLPQRRAQAAVIPTYNGARKLANLVPLLALLLAREGVTVLLHGMAQEAQRVGTFEILERLGHAPAADLAAAESALERHGLAAVPLALISPALARLIERRRDMGLRNSGHSLAKLLLPRGVPPASACRLVAVTHPDFVERLRELFAGAPGNLFLMRGVEGEPVVRLHAPQPIDYLGLQGELTTHLLANADEAAALPARDAQATAEWTRDVLEGRAAVPGALARQVALIAQHCRSSANARATLRLVSSQ